MSIRGAVQPIAVIIPSLNSPIIDKVVAAIESQVNATQIDEIIVVGRDEGRLLDLAGRARLIDTVTPVPPGTARNIGIKESSAELLIFLDSDCLPQPGWLQEHIDAHNAGHQVVCGGVAPDGQNYWSLSYNLTMFHEFFSTAEPGARDFLPTLNLSVERTVVDDVGLLDENLPRSQDVDWTTRMNRAGYQPYFWPAAAIQHRHNRTTWGKVWRDCVRSGHHARQVRLRHQETLKTPWLLNSRLFVRLFSPLIAAWVTLRILRTRPMTFLRNWFTLPAIYFTKIAWCWGAGKLTADS